MDSFLSLTVNGQSYSLEIDPDTPLLFVLRNDLGFKSVKYGCGSEQCGACKVLIDGRAVPTCKMPVRDVVGMEIITLEGLGTPENLHPLKEAFIEEQAVQCGYCTPGMIMTAQGLLNHIRYPTDDEINREMSENLCRCGIHDRIRRAIKLRIGRPENSPIYEMIIPDDDSMNNAPYQEGSGLSYSLLRNPDLDSWVRINEDDTITIYTGKVEIGQGIKTALAQIAAEELDVALSKIRMAVVDTDQSPDEGTTASSMSVETSGQAIRTAAAEAKHVLLSIGAERLNASLENLTISDGTITDLSNGRSTTYWEIFGGQKFNRHVSGKINPKKAEDYTLISKPVKRLDLLKKVTGAPIFVQDLEMPGMLYARIVRPPHYSARLSSVDIAPASKLPGVVKIVKDGSFLAVLAEREEQAVKAAEILQDNTTWKGESGLPLQEDIYNHLLNSPTQSFPVIDGASTPGPIPPLNPNKDNANTISATYLRPYQMHASLAPAAAVALYESNKMTTWVHSQGVYPIRDSIAKILGLEKDTVRIIQLEGSGSYGHNGADDAALDAALLARNIEGHSVAVKWTRQDDFSWEPYGPAMVMKLQASLGNDNKIVEWNHDVWSYPHLGRPNAAKNGSELLASWHLSNPYNQVEPNPIHAPHVGSHRNADPLYNFPNKRIVKHFVPNSLLRTSALRSLGAYGNIFAIESFMDDLAYMAGMDPVEFRLNHLEDARARAVIQAVAEESERRPKGKIGIADKSTSFGRGFAFSQYKNRQCYAAVVVDLWLDLRSGEIKLDHAVIAADAGLIINPDGLSNQLEGGFIFSASMTLNEKVKFDSGGISSKDWDSYPVLRFPNAPVIKVILINRRDKSSVGSGEAAQGPTAAAIANAIFDAGGIRLREIPFTPDRVLKALNSKKDMPS